VRPPRWLEDGSLAGELPPESPPPPVAAEESQRDRRIGAFGVDVVAECDRPTRSKEIQAG
jgi:hypothetical protein